MAVNLVNFTDASVLVRCCGTATLKSAVRNNSNALSHIMADWTEALRGPSAPPTVSEAFSWTAVNRQHSGIAVNTFPGGNLKTSQPLREHYKSLQEIWKTCMALRQCYLHKWPCQQRGFFSDVCKLQRESKGGHFHDSSYMLEQVPLRCSCGRCPCSST